MPKVKYYYDSETLSYKKIKTTRSTILKYVSAYLIGSSLFGFLFIFIASQYFESPKEKSLTRELENLEMQFEVLNKKIDNAEIVLSNIEERDNSIYRIYFEANPISEDKRMAGIGGVNRYKKYDGYDYTNLIKESAKRIDVLQKRMIIQSKSLDEITNLASKKEKLLKSIPAIQPINNNDLTRIASGYGRRTDPFTKVLKFHYFEE